MSKKLWENLLSLLSVQMLNYLVPIFTMPFLTRVLGPRHWGILAFAEGYATYLSVVIEFGFGLSASREISQLREDRDACSQFSANVFASQILLAVGAIALTGLLLLSGSINAYRPYLPLAICLALCRSLLPAWLFQGFEEMRGIAILNFLVNIASAAALFFFVKTSNDTWVPLNLRLMAAAISLVGAAVLASRMIDLRRPSRRGVIKVLREAAPMFLFRGLISLYTTLNVILIGVLGTPLAVAWFAGAEKLTKAAIGMIGPITQAFYPRISYLVRHDRQEAARITRLSAYFTIGVGVCGGLLLLIAAPELVRAFLGNKFDDSIPVLRVMSLLVPLIAAGSVFGLQWSLSWRLEKVYTIFVLIAAVANIALAQFFVHNWGALGMACVLVLCETIVNCGLIVFLRLKGLDPWTKQTDSNIPAAALTEIDAPV